jgi:hypothetical protein
MTRVVEIVIGGLILAVVVSLVVGWRSLAQIGTAVLLVGTGSAVIGILSMVGNWGGARNFEQQFTKTAWEQDAGERMHQEVKDTKRSYGFAALLGAAGLVLVMLGFALEALGR